ncbi:MAG: cobalamin-dependent protein [Dehalococcoidia bacterium]|nr:cobalamin-dependent protein [Dehalococcoidia bacterium]
MTDDILERLKGGLLELDMDAAVNAAREIVDKNDHKTVQDAVDTVTGALQIVGKRFQDGDWFLTELVYTGEISKEIMGILSPLMEAGARESAGTIVVGTVAGDLHDLGKNIFMNYAQSAGFNMIDLGIDVPGGKFVDAVKEHHPLALGMSCLLTSTDMEIGKVVEELKRQGLRDRVKVIIGGAALTEQFAEDAGVDAFAPDAITGTDIIRKWSAHL